MTQRDLCIGICSQAEISKIENDLNSPTVELLQQLAMRLQIPIALLFQDYIIEEDFIQRDHLLSDLLREQNYEAILKQIGQGKMEGGVEADILKSYIQIIIQLKKKHLDFRTAATLLSNVLTEKEVRLHSIQLFIRIKMAIANMYSEQNLFHLTETVYQELEKELEPVKSNAYLDALLKVYFNHCQILEYQGKSKESIQIAQKGYELCLTYNHTFLLGHFYYQFAHYEEVLGKSSDILKKHYSVAYTLFHTFDHQVRKNMMVRMKNDLLLFKFE